MSTNTNHLSDSLSSSSYHHPAISSLPKTLSSAQQLGQASPLLIESLIILYDSNYTTEQFDAACQAIFHPAVHMSCAACQVHSLADMHTVYRMQRQSFTRFAPLQCHVLVGEGRVVLDMVMEWTGLGGKVTREIGTILKARVEDGRVVELEEVWSLNDRLGKWFTFGRWNLFDGFRWLVTNAVLRCAKRKKA